MKKYRILVLVLTMADTQKIDVGNFLISIINEHANLNMVALKFVIPVIKINRIPNRQLLTKIFQSKQKPQTKLSILAFWPHERHYQQQQQKKGKKSTIHKKIKLEAIRDRSVNFARMCYHLNWTETHTTTKNSVRPNVMCSGIRFIADICWNDTFIMITTCCCLLASSWRRQTFESEDQCLFGSHHMLYMKHGARFKIYIVITLNPFGNYYFCGEKC